MVELTLFSRQAAAEALRSLRSRAIAPLTVPTRKGVKRTIHRRGRGRVRKRKMKGDERREILGDTPLFNSNASEPWAAENIRTGAIATAGIEAIRMELRNGGIIPWQQVVSDGGCWYSMASIMEANSWERVSIE